ncbi:hypothetical protein [Caldiplasma sukawensis]
MTKHMVCPSCGSEKIFADSGLITGKYSCPDCGYVGSVIFEFDDQEYEIFMRRLKKSGNR